MNRFRYVVFGIALISLCAFVLTGAAQDMPRAAQPPPSPGEPGDPDGSQPWSPQLVTTLGAGVLLFGLTVIVAIAYLIKQGKPPDLVVKAFSVPLIVVAAVFLVVTGYSSQQIAPVIGLLGTIAGYLLGKEVDRKGTKPAEPAPKEEQTA